MNERKKDQDPTVAQIVETIKAFYLEAEQSNAIQIAPAWLAQRTLEHYDPDGVSPPHVAWAATLEFRQLARSVCAHPRVGGEVVEGEPIQGQLYVGDVLQDRYPCDRGPDGPVYVRRENLTLAERRAVAALLRKTGLARIRHADLLDQETDEKLARGDFDAAA